MISEGLYRMIAEAIGTDNFYKLAEIVGGTTIYIPKPESLTRPVRDARIKKEFTGYNHQELARKYGVTERWVRRICGPRTSGRADRDLRLPGRPRGRIRGRGDLATLRSASYIKFHKTTLK